MNSSMYEAFYNFDALKADLISYLSDLVNFRKDGRYKIWLDVVKKPDCNDSVLLLVARTVGLDLRYYKSILPSIANRTMELYSFVEKMDIDSFLKTDDLDCYVSHYLLNIGLLIKKNHEDTKISFDFNGVDPLLIAWIEKIGKDLKEQFTNAGASNLDFVNSNLTWQDVELLNYDKEPGEEDLWKKHIFLAYKLRDWIYHYHFTRIRATTKSDNPYVLAFDIPCFVDNPSYVGEQVNTSFRLNLKQEVVDYKISVDFLKTYGNFFKYFAIGKYDEAKATLPKSLDDCKYLWQIYCLKHDISDKREYNNIKRLLDIDMQMFSSLVLHGFPENRITYKDYYITSTYTYADYIFIHDDKNTIDDIEFSNIPLFKNLEMITLSSNLEETIDILFKGLNRGVNSLVNGGGGYCNGRNPTFNIINTFNQNGPLSFHKLLSKVGRIKKQIIGTDMRNSNGHKNTLFEDTIEEPMIRFRDTSDQISGTYDKDFRLPVDDFFSAVDTYANIQIGNYSSLYSFANLYDDLIALAYMVPAKTEYYLDVIEKYQNCLEKDRGDGLSFYQDFMNKLIDGLRQVNTYNGMKLSDAEHDAIMSYLTNSVDKISLINIAKTVDCSSLDFNLIISDIEYQKIKRAMKKRGR